MVSATEHELLRFQLNMWRGLKPVPHVQLDPTVVDAVIFKLFDINHRRQSRMIGASI